MSMDIYAAVTDRIIAALEQNIIPWKKPWVGTGDAVSHATGKPYSLLNQLLVGRPGEWITFKQALEEGGHVRKGEKSRIVVFWKLLKVKDEDTDEEKEVPFLRYNSVFHIDQCEGITPKYTKPMPDVVQPDAEAEKLMQAYLVRSGVKLTEQPGDTSCYIPSRDAIVLPLKKQFLSTGEYYSTAFHEAAHSTGHPSRLNRFDAESMHFASESYSKEELVAELSAAALVHRVGLETGDSFRNSTAYIQNWLQALKEDKRLIVSAAGRAEKAVQMILGEDETRV